MKKVNSNMESARAKISELKGQEIKIRYNRGRNKICFYDGCIDEIYPSVFVVKIQNEIFDKITCSYQDVLCGDIKFKIK